MSSGDAPLRETNSGDQRRRPARPTNPSRPIRSECLRLDRVPLQPELLDLDPADRIPRSDQTVRSIA
jgi:hypothetical protein